MPTTDCVRRRRTLSANSFVVSYKWLPNSVALRLFLSISALSFHRHETLKAVDEELLIFSYVVYCLPENSTDNAIVNFEE